MTGQLRDSLWHATACAAPDIAQLEQDLVVDVVIIGAGFTGLSTALHLAKSGVSVALLEAQEVGFGGSGRNVGLANAGLWLEPDQLDRQLGQAAGRRLYEALAVAPEYVYGLINDYKMDCEAVRHGTLHCAVGKRGLAQLQRRCEQMQRRSAPVQLLNGTDAQARTGSNKFSAALFDPRAGTIQPLSYARGLAHAAVKEGASLFEQSPVEAILPAQDRWLVKTYKGSVTAERVVLATNAYAEYGSKDQAQKFVPIFYSQLASTPLPDKVLDSLLPNKEGCWDTCAVMSSFRLDQRGRLIFGGMGGKNSYHAHWATQRVTDLFPLLKKIDWEYSWTGKIAYSKDHLPHCQQLQHGLFSVAGYSGRGIGPGTIMGKELAEWFTNQRAELSVPTTRLHDIPLRELKRVFYEIGAHTYHSGQNAHILR